MTTTIKELTLPKVELLPSRKHEDYPVRIDEGLKAIWDYRDQLIGLHRASVDALEQECLGRLRGIEGIEVLTEDRRAKLKSKEGQEILVVEIKSVAEEKGRKITIASDQYSSRKHAEMVIDLFRRAQERIDSQYLDRAQQGGTALNHFTNLARELTHVDLIYSRRQEGPLYGAYLLIVQGRGGEEYCYGTKIRVDKGEQAIKIAPWDDQRGLALFAGLSRMGASHGHLGTEAAEYLRNVPGLEGTWELHRVFNPITSFGLDEVVEDAARQLVEDRFGKAAKDYTFGLDEPERKT